jgi:hypothetical protein
MYNTQTHTLHHITFHQAASCEGMPAAAVRIYAA